MSFISRSFYQKLVSKKLIKNRFFLLNFIFPHKREFWSLVEFLSTLNTIKLHIINYMYYKYSLLLFAIYTSKKSNF